MKTCPVCGARAFDDAEVCYGCLYRFSDEAPTRATEKTTNGLPSFLIRLKAMPSGEGEYRWSCTVEPDDKTIPGAT